MDVDGVGSGGVSTVRVVAAGALATAALPQQEAVLRGSMASQSLAADVMNDVYQVVGCCRSPRS